MSTVNKSIGAIQRKLGFPSNPGIGIIGEAYIETVDEKVTELNLSREPRLISKARITVDCNVAEYSLDSRAPGFDKARILYTSDEGCPNFYRREVDLVPLESLTTWYDGGDAAGILLNYSNLKHTATAAAVYHDVNRGWMIEFGPVPSQSAEYILVYEIATIRPQSRDEVGFRFEQFDGYVTDCTCLRLLAHCEWKGMPPEEWPAKRRELAGSMAQGYGLVVDVTRGDRLFWKWKHSTKNPSGVKSIPFGYGRW